MKMQAAKFELEDKKECVSVTLRDASGKPVLIGVHGDWEIFLGNDHEERAYRVVKTRHGGYKLKERTLL